MDIYNNENCYMPAVIWHGTSMMETHNFFPQNLLIFIQLFVES